MDKFTPEDSMANPSDLIVSVLNDNKTFQDFVDAMSVVFETNVESPILQLEEVRYLGPNTEDTTLESTARLLGFDTSSDVLKMNKYNLLRLVTQLPLYPDSNSTPLFRNFIDILLNAITDIQYLYTKDYVNFYVEPKGGLVYDGGAWFKVTHIELNIALMNLNLIEVQEGQSVFSRIVEVFHTFAPAPLVIERLNLLVVIRDEDWIGGKAFGFAAKIDESNIEHFVIIE